MKITIPETGVGTGTWNHRAIRHPDGEDTVLIVHEVHYDAAGKVRGWTQNGATVSGETLIEVRECLLRMARALLEPVLVERTVEGRLTLVEESTGELAHSTAVADLPAEQRQELEALAELVERTAATAQKQNH